MRDAFEKSRTTSIGIEVLPCIHRAVAEGVSRCSRC
jgi:hypothetical protein